MEGHHQGHWRLKKKGGQEPLVFLCSWTSPKKQAELLAAGDLLTALSYSMLAKTRPVLENSWRLRLFAVLPQPWIRPAETKSFHPSLACPRAELLHFREQPHHWCHSEQEPHSPLAPSKLKSLAHQQLPQSQKPQQMKLRLSMSQKHGGIQSCLRSRGPRGAPNLPAAPPAHRASRLPAARTAPARPASGKTAPESEEIMWALGRLPASSWHFHCAILSLNPNIVFSDSILLQFLNRL